MNQLRQFGKDFEKQNKRPDSECPSDGKQEESWRDWKAELKQENLDLTEKVEKMNQKFQEERRNLKAEIKQLQVAVEKSQKRAAQNASIRVRNARVVTPLRQQSTITRGKAIISRIRTGSAKHIIKRPNEPSSPTEALSQYRQHWIRRTQSDRDMTVKPIR